MLSGGDQNVSRSGFTKVEGFSDPDDYVDIESGTIPLSHTLSLCAHMYVVHVFLV